MQYPGQASQDYADTIFRAVALTGMKTIKTCPCKLEHTD